MGAELDNYFITTKEGVVQEINPLTGEVVEESPCPSKAIAGTARQREQNRGALVGMNKWVYTEQWKSIICQHIAKAHNGTLREFYKLPGTPCSGVLAQWRASHPELEKAIRAAKRMRAEQAFEKIIEDTEKEGILDKESVPGAKLRFDKLKYQARVDNPEAYGDKINGGSGEGGVTIVVDTGIRRAEPITVDGEVKNEQILGPEDGAISGSDDQKG